MIELLVKDLDKETTEAKVSEKDAQADYEKLMVDAGDKRAADAKALTEKSKTKADLEGELETEVAEKKATSKEHAATVQYIAALHSDCDFLVKFYQTRKQARTDEIDALSNAKAVLSGADYSLVQTSARSRRFMAPRP